MRPIRHLPGSWPGCLVQLQDNIGLFCSRLEINGYAFPIDSCDNNGLILRARVLISTSEHLVCKSTQEILSATAERGFPGSIPTSLKLRMVLWCGVKLSTCVYYYYLIMQSLCHLHKYIYLKQCEVFYLLSAKMPNIRWVLIQSHISLLMQMTFNTMISW